MSVSYLLPWKWKECSVTVSPTRASIVWKIRYFSKMDAKTGDYLESQTFEFLKGTWLIIMCPNGDDESTTGEVFPSLTRVTSTVESQKVRFKFFYRDKFMNEYHSTERVSSFKKNSSCGPTSRIRMKDLLGVELRELLLPEDTLTVCCELKDPDAGEQEEAPPGLEEKTESFNNEHKRLSEDLTTVYETAPFPDVTLKVGEEEFPAHKAILSARSSVFRAMFQAGMQENQVGVINILEMEAQTARAMLRYVYTGNIPDLENNSARDLYVVADRYELLGLKACCQLFLLENMSVDNVCQQALLADLHSDDALKSAVRQFLRKNQQQVLESDIWNEYATEKPAFFLTLITSALLNR